MTASIRIAAMLCVASLGFLAQGCATSQQAVTPVHASGTTAFQQQAQVKTTLAHLVSAYSAKKLWRFMSFVAEDFTGDAMILEGAVRKDFSSQHNTGIRYTVNNITFNDKGDAASVGINFVRNQVDIKTGKVVNQNGSTELVFKKEDGIFKLYSMKKPFLFGTSDN